jgi:hypothetical protein
VVEQSASGCTGHSEGAFAVESDPEGKDRDLNPRLFEAITHQHVAQLEG